MIKGLALVSVFFLASTIKAEMPTNFGNAERCTLVRISQDPKNSRPILSDVKAINIYNEVSILQNPDFRKTHNTMVTLSTGSKADEFYGDQFYMTKQSVAFYDKDNTLITDINKYDKDVLQSKYTHKFSSGDIVGSKRIELVAIHNVTSFVDHYYSNNVVLLYSMQEKVTPTTTRSFKASLEFKCAAYSKAQEVLK